MFFFFNKNRYSSSSSSSSNMLFDVCLGAKQRNLQERGASSDCEFRERQSLTSFLLQP